MAKGWLTPWAIKDTAADKWIWQSDDPLLPKWEFPNRSGEVVLDTTPDPATIHDVTTTRAIDGTNYTNSTGKAITVMVTVTGNSALILTGGINSGGWLYIRKDIPAGAGLFHDLVFVVPNGCGYAISQTAPADAVLWAWLEVY